MYGSKLCSRAYSIRSDIDSLKTREVGNIAKTKKHDTGYKGIFAKKRNFLHFLKKYIKADWVDGIDEKDLTPVNTTFVDEEYQNRESDVVYKAKIRGTEVIFYILLELQSTVDHTMPFRLLKYIVELMKREFDNAPRNERETKDYRLPAVIPIILYNGADNWTAVRSFREYVQGHGEFGEYIVDFRYFLFDLNRNTGETILSTNHLLDIIFALDQKTNRENMAQMFKIAFDRLSRMSEDDQNNLMGWIKHIYLNYIQNEDAKIEIINKFKRGEIVNMTYAIDRYIEEERQKGVQETRIDIAKQLLDVLDDKTIAQKTDLEIKEVKKLRKNFYQKSCDKGV